MMEIALIFASVVIAYILGLPIVNLVSKHKKEMEAPSNDDDE